MEQKHLSQDVFGSFLKLENLSTDQLGLGTLGVKKNCFKTECTGTTDNRQKAVSLQELVYRLRKITIKMYR